MKSIDLSVIIPAYNEEKNIKTTIQNLCKYLDNIGISFEIMIIDDGSSDRTSNQVEDMQSSDNYQKDIQLRKNISNKGKGYSVRRGVLESKGKIIVFMDADLAYELDTIQTMYEAVLRGYQVVIGSRNLPQSKMNAKVPILRSISGKVYSWIIQLLMFQGISDTQCGIKSFDGQIAKELFSHITINDFGFDVELLFLAKKYNYSILSIPVTMVNHRRESRVNVICDSIKMFIDLFVIKLNNLFGKY